MVGWRVSTAMESCRKWAGSALQRPLRRTPGASARCHCGPSGAPYAVPSTGVLRCVVPRYSAEAAIMATLRHPCIVSYMGACLDPPCLVMEVRGGRVEVVGWRLCGDRGLWGGDWCMVHGGWRVEGAQGAACGTVQVWHTAQLWRSGKEGLDIVPEDALKLPALKLPLPWLALTHSPPCTRCFPFPATRVPPQYCARGSVYGVLSGAAINAEAAANLTWPRLLRFAWDAAKGLLYLHTLNPPVIHR